MRSSLGAALGLLLFLSGSRRAEEPSGSPRELTQAGIRHLEAREYHQAIKSFEGALAALPADKAVREGLARAHAGLGVEFANSGDHLPAREAFERSLRVAEDAIARFGLGYLDFLENRDRPARDNLERALALDPDDAPAHKLLALLDYRRGETAAARKRIERAARLDPKDKESEALEKRWTREEELSRKLAESSTRHFLVRADRDLHPDGVREILQLLESIHDSIGQALGHWPRQRIPVLLLSESDFHAATGSYHWVGGMYDGQIKVPIRAEDGKPGADRRLLKQTLRHEYVHAVIKDLSPGCPNWLNEGIAQYFEIEDDREREGKGKAAEERLTRRRKVDEELRKNRSGRIPLEKVPPRMWEISDQNLARWMYLEGLGFVSYLAEHHRAFRLRLLLVAHRREGSIGKAFQSTYGAGLADLEEKWWGALQVGGKEP